MTLGNDETGTMFSTIRLKMKDAPPPLFFAVPLAANLKHRRAHCTPANYATRYNIAVVIVKYTIGKREDIEENAEH